ALAWLALSGASVHATETIWLDTLDLRGIRQGWGAPAANRSVGGRPLSISGHKYERGIGTHAESGFLLQVDSEAAEFSALVGVDDEVGRGHGSVVFVVVGDGVTRWRSGLVRGGEPAREVRVELRGVKSLELIVEDGDDAEDEDHADWAMAKLEVVRKRPVPEAFAHQLAIDPDQRFQTIDHLGA